jgi:hypothetical protein
MALATTTISARQITTDECLEVMNGSVLRPTVEANVMTVSFLAVCLPGETVRENPRCLFGVDRVAPVLLFGVGGSV